MNDNEDPARFVRMQELFHAACTLPMPERRAFLEKECGADSALRARVEELLAHAQDGEPVPDQIGPYRILEQIGEGGMGTVYRAEQQAPVRRIAAVKLIRRGGGSRDVVARFTQEQQALALMQHDGIARVFDCGTTGQGQPYFAMEYVKGVPLTDYCDRNRLTVAQRIGLIQQVCAAVTHAHQKGVVHRDLKPRNVLVAEDAGKVQVKVIDFGLAKAMGQDLVAGGPQTLAGMVIGTPEYMAPEQADPTNADIDTRADVYAIGVMLYELLIGALPFTSAQVRGAGMLEMQRVLREVEPERPSTKLTTVRETATAVASTRRTTVGALQRVLRSDLDWVVLKALEKDRARRYDTANALSRDLQRYLDHEPLEAGPPSAMYRLRKLLRKYRLQSSAAAAVLLAIIVGGAGVYFEFRRAEGEAVRANLALADSRGLLGDLAARNARFDEAIRHYGAALELAPPEHLRIRLKLARVYEAGSRPDLALQALEELERRPDLGRHEAEVELLRGDHLLFVDAKADLAAECLRGALASGDLSAADQHYARALLGPDLPTVFRHLEKCLEEDRYHRAASEAIVPCLMFLGMKETAAKYGRTFATIYAGDPLGLVLAAASLRMNGEAAAARQTLVTAAQEAPEMPLEPVTEVVELFDELDRGFAFGAQTDITLHATEAVVAAFTSMHRFVTTTAERLQEVRSAQAAAPLLRRMHPLVARSHQIFTEGLTAGGVIEKLGRSSFAVQKKAVDGSLALVPEAMLFLYRANLHCSERHWQEADADLEQALSTPSLFDIGATARLLQLQVLNELLALASKRGADLSGLHDRMRGRIDELAKGGRLPPAHLGLMINLCANMGDVERARGIADRYNQEHPDDLQAWFFRSAVLYLEGHYEGALYWADQILRKQPEDERARRWGRKAQDKIGHIGRPGSDLALDEFLSTSPLGSK